jgi:hypothetical protein
VSDKFALRYAINAERWVRSVVVFSDWEQIANFPYNGKDNMVNEQSAVFSKLSAWNHNIEVMAVDSKWYSNKVVFDINIVTEDKEPPIVLESKTRVSQLDNWRYQVSIILQDNLSYIEYGKIFTTEKTILEFKWQAAVFTLTDLVPVNVLAKDSYWNTLETTINLSL